MKTKEKNCNYRQDIVSYLSQVFKIFCSMKMHAIEAGFGGGGGVEPCACYWSKNSYSSSGDNYSPTEKVKNWKRDQLKNLKILIIKDLHDKKDS